MGRKAIISAAQSYLTQGITTQPIPFLSKVHAYAPRITKESEWFEGQLPGTNVGAVIYLWIPDQHERRVELRGAPPGGKMRYYSLELACFLRSVLAKTTDAETDNDEFLDALVTWIAHDKTFASNGVIFEAGEGTGFDRPDVVVRSTLPKNIRGQMFQTFSSVTVQVLEFVPD